MMDLSKTVKIPVWRNKKADRTYTSPRSQVIVDCLFSEPQREWSIDELVTRAYGSNTPRNRHSFSALLYRLRERLKVPIETIYSPTARRHYRIRGA